MNARNRVPWQTALALAASLAVAPVTAALDIRLPEETARYPGSDLPGYALVQRNCLLCHSAEYAQYQPPTSSRGYWDATVRKMKKPFGAPLADEDIPAIVDYLVAMFGPASSAPAVRSPAADTPMTAKAATLPASAAVRGDGAAILAANNCMVCHAVNTKLVGPAFRDVAAKYAGKADAAAQVASSIRSGGSGKWGPVPMPPYPGVSDEDVRTLSAWILGR